MSTAIITGASSGLGKEFFAAILEQCPEVDEFWLIARRKKRLEEMAENATGVSIIPLPLNLSEKESFELLERILEERKPNIKLLVNNAGFGKLGDLVDADPWVQRGMTELNVSAVATMTALCLPHMGHGSLIVNVSSIASFAPTPGMAVYGGTKAFVTSFTQALRHENKARGIAAIAVCPGPMDTEFNAVAGIGGGASPTFESLPRESPQKIAAGAIRKGLCGKALYTGRLFYKFYRLLSKLLPDTLLVKFTDL